MGDSRRLYFEYLGQPTGGQTFAFHQLQQFLFHFRDFYKNKLFSFVKQIFYTIVNANNLLIIFTFVNHDILLNTTLSVYFILLFIQKYRINWLLVYYIVKFILIAVFQRLRGFLDLFCCFVYLYIQCKTLVFSDQLFIIQYFDLREIFTLHDLFPLLGYFTKV